MSDLLTEAITTLRRVQAVLAAEAPDPMSVAAATIPSGAVFKSLADGKVRTKDEYLRGLATWPSGPRLALPEDPVRYGEDWPLLSHGAPTVLLGWPFEDLPARGWEGVGSKSQLGWPDDQPAGDPLYPKALQTQSRVHRVAVLADPGQAPATIDGTQALAVAAGVCLQVADQLSGWQPRPDQARRFRAEAMALQQHADACVAALGSSMAWVEPFDQAHPATVSSRPPASPTVPAQLRGTVETRPVQQSERTSPPCLY